MLLLACGHVDLSLFFVNIRARLLLVVNQGRNFLKGRVGVCDVERRLLRVAAIGQEVGLDLDIVVYSRRGHVLPLVQVDHALFVSLDLLHRLVLLPELRLGLDLVSNVGVHFVYLTLVIDSTLVWLLK